MKISKFFKEKNKILALILLTILLLQAVIISYVRSPLGDESWHISRGAYALKMKDTRRNIGHPIFINLLSAVPLAFLPNLKVPVGDYILQEYGHLFLFHNNYKPQTIIFLGRIPIIILSILLGFFIFKWAKQLYGEKAGLFALTLYVFSPNIIAQSAVIATDLGAACFFFLAVYCFWKFVKSPTKINLVLAGITFGFAFISKYTSIILIPLFFIFVFIVSFYKTRRSNVLKKDLRKILRKAYKFSISFFIILIIAWFVINAAYGFQGTFSSINQNMQKKDLQANASMYQESLDMITPPFFNKKAVGFVTNNVPILFPYYYLKGLHFSFYHYGHLAPLCESTFFLGKMHYGPIHYYYLVLFLIKTPIPFLIFFILSIFIFKKIKKDMLNECFLIIPALLFIIALSIKPSCTGIRHILPAFPFIFVFISKIVNFKTKVKYKKIFYSVISILILWYVISSLSVFPNNLAYFNEFVGVENGYRYSTHVDVDWGGSTREIKDYMDKHRIKDIKISYFGPFPPEHYNISYLYLPSENFMPENFTGHISCEGDLCNCTPTEGIIAINVMNLHNFLPKQGCFDWLKEHEPIDKLRYSIFIYNITESRGSSIENCTPKKGIIAISATYLQGEFLKDMDCYSWLKKYEPIDKIGYSILIYNISEENH